MVSKNVRAISTLVDDSHEAVVQQAIDATFGHRSSSPPRFSSSDRNAWYAGFEIDTSHAEVAYHEQRLQETQWEEEEIAEYVDYLADFHADFHDLRNSSEHADCLSATSCAASQRLAAELLNSGSSGIAYPSVPRRGGNCMACFRPVLITHVRRAGTFPICISELNNLPYHSTHPGVPVVRGGQCSVECAT
jgi:hypothetical protein